jgi:hypothetical protein
MKNQMWALAWATLALALTAASAIGSAVPMDEFETLDGWTTAASPGARAEIARDAGHGGMAMRIDFDFGGGGGFVLARKAFSLKLPENYVFRFRVRGQAPPNNLEFKLVAPGYKDVWWSVERDFEFPAEWTQVTIRRSRLQFAWGPSGGEPLRKLAGIEIAISSGSGGKGSVWIDDLRFEPREADGTDLSRPTVTASTSTDGHDVALALDPDRARSWRSGTLAPNQWLQLDYGRRAEYGGLVIDWDPEDFATEYRVEVSDDAEAWTTAYRCTAGNGGRDYIYLHDAESRYVRLDLEASSRGQGYGIRHLDVKPYAFSASPNQFFEHIAADSPRGLFPKYFSGQQTYWTVIGVNGDDREALLNEEGMLEVGKGMFSLEPFLYLDGKLVTWADVRTTQELEHGYLPIPSVNWHDDRVSLRVTAVATGPPGASTLWARYRIANRSDTHQSLVLFLAVRPFQVLPPWQSLNMVGGVSKIRSIEYDGRKVWVNGSQAVVSYPPPARFGAATFEEGLTTLLGEGKMPTTTEESDPFGYASGAMQFFIDVPAGQSQSVDVAVPFHEDSTVPEGTTADFDRLLEATAADWETILDRVEIQVPPEQARLGRSLKSNLAYILVNRRGASIQPGPRTYARSWIRDGAFTCTALLELGFTEEVREFIRWFASHQFPNGRIPCCVDYRGADPTPENDSDGQFIFTVAEYYRFTRDIGFLEEMWPAVVRSANHIDAMRRQRMTDLYRKPGKAAYFGLVPESISHEGYSSHPVHSYWDGFFSLRGLKDAAFLAVVVGDSSRAHRFATMRDEFRKDLYASIEAAMKIHKVDYVPASVELGDFDPTSTAIAISTIGELANLPRPALDTTFEKYWENVLERRKEPGAQENYTPYEIRNVDALMRLGWRDRAYELLEWLVADQRPQAWNEWQEIVWLDPALPRFIGDMPHTWIGSTFIRAVRDMYAYERDDDRALVLAHGLPASWLAGGTGVKRLPTYYGVLHYRLATEGESAYRLRLSGDLAVPPGGIVVRPPLPAPLRRVLVDGEPIESFDAESATIRVFPADVLLEFGGETGG